MRRSALKRRPKSESPYERELAEVVPLVMARAQNRCEVNLTGCMGHAMATPHHRKRRTQGGTNRMVNLLAVCWSCHHWIHDHPAKSYDLGLLVRHRESEEKHRWL